MTRLGQRVFNGFAILSLILIPVLLLRIINYQKPPPPAALPPATQLADGTWVFYYHDTPTDPRMMYWIVVAVLSLFLVLWAVAFIRKRKRISS
jgi:hypothetical protein